MLTILRKPAIVAVIASLRDLDEILNLPAKYFDLCELRIDLLHGSSRDLEALIGKIPFPKDRYRAGH